MLIFVYTILIVAFVGEYILIKLGVPSTIATMPLEMLSAITVIVVIARAISRKSITLHFKYVLILFFMLMMIFANTIINQVQPGSIFYGIREYLRFIPFFFIPAVYNFSEEQVKKITKLIFILILIQVPLISYQRLIEYSHLLSGDSSSGTFKDPAHAAIITIIAITFLIAFYLRQKISLKLLLILSPLLVLPAALNETKSALFILPLALITPILLIEDRRKKLRKIFPVFVFGFFFIAIFVFVYNMHYGKRLDGNILTFLLKGENVEGYLHRGATVKSDGTKEGEVGRIDSITLPFEVFADQPIKYLFGVGIGNATAKQESKLIGGKYSYKYRKHGGRVTTASQLIWETGLVGFLVFVLIILLIFFDALKLRHGDRTENIIALSWAAITPIILMMLFYKNSIATQPAATFFWLISGYIAAQRYRQKKSLK